MLRGFIKYTAALASMLFFIYLGILAADLAHSSYKGFKRGQKDSHNARVREDLKAKAKAKNEKG